MARNLNRVELIGNITRDPELKTLTGDRNCCVFGLATNRSYRTVEGKDHEDTTFHRIVCWDKLAVLCNQFLQKGRKVYVEGRIANRTYTDKSGVERTVYEIVIDDMILLDQRTST
jgi:single-strand DNA-binding protein